MRQLILVGAPMSGSFLLEYGLFAAAAQLMGWIGTVALAAHQIALQITAVMFMVPFGIATAATVRVGHAAGRGDAVAARRAGFAAIVLGVAFMAAMTLLVALTRDSCRCCSSGRRARPADRRARGLAAGARREFFIADGVQTIAAGSLRGLNDTRVPLRLPPSASGWSASRAAGCSASPSALAPTGSGSGFRSASRSTRCC